MGRILGGGDGRSLGIFFNGFLFCFFFFWLSLEMKTMNCRSDDPVTCSLVLHPRQCLCGRSSGCDPVTGFVNPPCAFHHDISMWG